MVVLPYHELKVKDYNEPELERIIASSQTEWFNYHNFLTALLPLDLLRNDEFYYHLYNKYTFCVCIFILPN